MTRLLPEITGIKAFDHDGLVELAKELGLPGFRVKQLESWIYGKGVSSYDEMTNLSKDLRSKLSESYPLIPAKITKKLVSSDGSRKYIVEYPDGTAIETVGIPSNDRLTVCFSTQAGCKMGCSFCATAKGGFKRNLAPGEIAEQVLLVSKDFRRRVTNAVGMGQGEPFLNYDSVLGAARFLNSPDCFNIGARHITLSTCGIIPMISRFAREPEQFTLAVSLHSAVQNTRDKIMPGVSGYTLDRLRSSIASYSDSTGRRPTFEYAMINGVNDTDYELDALIEFCHGMLCHVNLISLNRIGGFGHQPSANKRVKYFADTLNSRGIETSIRNSRGADIQGACGQLIQNYEQ